jgi:hypothetical protein
MSLVASALQTQWTDTPAPHSLAGKVTSMRVLDPTEGNEKTSLLELGEPFDVRVAWELTGPGTPAVGGYWVVDLYSDDIDGVGTMVMPALQATIHIIGGVSPLKFHHTFHVPASVSKEGVYQLTATISHSPTGNPNKVSEMFGYAESGPIRIANTVVESN